MSPTLVSSRAAQIFRQGESKFGEEEVSFPSIQISGLVYSEETAPGVPSMGFVSSYTVANAGVVLLQPNSDQPCTWRGHRILSEAELERLDFPYPPEPGWELR